MIDDLFFVKSSFYQVCRNRNGRKGPMKIKQENDFRGFVAWVL